MAAGGEGESDDGSADGSEENPADPASESEGDNDSSAKKKDTSQQDIKVDKQQAGGKQEEQAKPEKQQENGQKKEDSSQQENKDSSRSSSSSGEDAKGTGGGTQGKSQDNVKGPERSAKNTTEGEPPSAVSNKVLRPPHIGQHVEPEQLSVLDVCNPMCLLSGLHTSSVSSVGVDLT